MAFIGIKEAFFIKKHLHEVKHVTLGPNGGDVLRIHMIPPRKSLNNKIPSVIIVNGQDIVPVNLSWAILLCAFMDAIAPYDGKEFSESDWEPVVSATVKSVRTVYRTVKEDRLKGDLWTIITVLMDIAQGKSPQANIGQMTIGEYARHMKAPHRMDLMISAMTREGSWNCNQKCLHCYAAGQALADAEELPTHAWKQIIDRCRKAGIPQITFTGGEPTLREDLTELVEHARWFVTRLNTNGVLLTKALCAKLYEASLDSVQVTLYSADEKTHNGLVGAENWDKTVEGIRNALSANLNVSINTPLCTLNSDYTDTLKLAHSLGIKYVSCSGLIPAGSAREEGSVSTRLTSKALADILNSAFIYCKQNGMDIVFTSPGWVAEEKLRRIGFISIPSCGAALSNMAVTPDGQVVPCQSGLSGKALGNMQTDPWNKIWDSPACFKIRRESAKMRQVCPLRSGLEASI